MGNICLDPKPRNCITFWNSEYSTQKLPQSMEQQGAWQQSRALWSAQLQCTGPIKKHCCALAKIISSNFAMSKTLQHSEPA